MRPRRLSILGVGLLGGSIGLAVKSIAKDCKVVGYGHRRSSLDAAIQMGAIDEAYDDPASAVRGADLVILCTPVGTFPQLFEQIARAVADQAVITDVGSTKRSAAALAEELLPKNVSFVGSHPMAGSEKRGVQFARADLFQNATCILTPIEKTSPNALEKIDSFWRLLGMQTTRLSPADHDRLICDISHLPHAVAAALVAMQDEQALGLAGKGFLDATRIAGGDGGLWRDIFVDNRDNLRASIQKLQENLEGLLAYLEPDNADALRTWLNEAGERRRQLLEEKFPDQRADRG